MEGNGPFTQFGDDYDPVLSHLTQLGLHPRSLILGPGPGLIDRTPEQKLERASLAVSARYHFRRPGPERAAEETGSHAQRPVFIIIGLFDDPDMAPKELCLFIIHDRWVF